ncbi:MAG: hypothetical protein ACKVU4_11920 [Phycisphaerales bacterium]
MEPIKLAQAVGAPAALSLIILVLGHRAWRRGDPGRPATGATNALAITAALVLAFILMGLWQGVWASDAARRIPLVTAVVLAAELVARLSARPRVAIAARIAATVLVLAALAHPYLRFTIWPRRFGLWMPGLGVALLAWWLSIDRLGARERGIRLPILLWMTASAASVLLLLGAHSQMFALLAASVAAGVGGVVVLAAWRPRISSEGAAAAAAALLGSLVLLGALGGDQPWWMTVWIAASVAALPFTVVVARLPLVARLRPWKATLICLLAAVAIVAPVIIVAYRAYTAVNRY